MNEIMPRFDVDPEFLRQQGLSKTFPERFWAQVFITETHWLWEGDRRFPGGHGRIWRGTRHANGSWNHWIFAHVASLLMHTLEPIPKGKLVLHRCPGKHIAWCVNPAHLYIGDADDNARDLQEQVAQGFITVDYDIRYGPDNAATKLTQAQHDSIRARFTGRHGEEITLAKEYGVTGATIGNIVRGGWWNGVKYPPTPAYIAMIARWKKERERAHKPWPPIGEANNKAKLTREIVERIRAEYTGSQGQQTALALKYGIQQPAIWKILTHRTWK